MQDKNKILQIISFLLFIWLFFLLSQKIILPTADLGRHIKNGEMIFSGKWDVLYKNFYSYTHPDFPFVNHHWLSGAIFFIIYKFFGFTGLHIFYISTLLLAVYIILSSLNHKLNKETSLLTLLLALPLIAYRKEVRPEIFSYLFFSICVCLIFKYKQGKISFKKFIFFYTLIEFFWANLHILFPLGIILLFFALIEALVNKKEIKKIIFTLLSSGLITLLNPNLLKGALIPLLIFQNYSYMIVENQSLFFAIKRIPSALYFYTLIFIIGLIILSFYKINLDFKKNGFVYLTTLLFLFLSLKYIRNISFLGLSSLLFLNTKLKHFDKNTLISLAAIIVPLIFLTFPFSSLFNPFKNPFLGWGLSPGSNFSAVFFKKTGLKGPIFNNYDIGSYLIFHLFPKEKIFADNRPEAYPKDFWQKEYIKAQEDEKIWEIIQEKYKFNVIYFYRHDATPWAQPFLIRRINDENWIPVYVDAYTLIFVKNNEQNKKIIERYQLPKSIFKISKH